jgi:tetratricopeptide (TPR) repeat protein
MALTISSWAAAADDGVAAAGLLRDAATEVSYLSFDRAFPLFRQAEQLAPDGSPQWQQAVFGEAVCLQQIAPATAERLAEASRLYRQLAEKPGAYSAQSMMALGRIAELVDYLGDVPDRPAARQWYEKARLAVGDDAPLASEAQLRFAATYVQETEAEPVRKGISILEDWLAKHPANPLASAMWQYAGDTYFYPLNEYARAIHCYLKADALGLLEKGREGPLCWRIANLAERVGDRDVAVRYYTKVIVKTPAGGKAYESQLALKRLGAPVPPIELFKKPASTTAPAEGVR